MSVKETIIQLKAKAQPLEERLDRIHIAIAELEDLLPVEKVEKSQRMRVVVESHSGKVRHAIAEALFTEGTEMHRRELMEKLREEALYPGQDPQKEMRNMASQLSDDRRFVKVGKLGSGYWRLTDIAWAEMESQADTATNGTGDGPIVVNPGQATIMPAGDPYD